MAGYKITKEVEVRPGQFYREYAGSSLDSKPAHTDERTGNMAVEADTGDVYMYLEGEPGTWNKFCSMGGDGT